MTAKQPHILDILQQRGLLDSVTDPAVRELLDTPQTVYCGFDPSCDSLQAGNLVAIITLAHFQRCGHKVIALVGGATGMIGDPSGKTVERSLLSAEDVVRNAEGIKENLTRFLDFANAAAPAVIMNNNDWLGEFSLIGFLRDVGKHFRMGTMLNKESVRSRLDSESGMSFTEFSYQMLQAYDFLHLLQTADCRVQIGGTDQWGNITAGTDLIGRLTADRAFGVTMPLVCDSAGQKFGKSAGNAIYLDHRRTSYYDFYQFFIRTSDADVIRYLKIFTFLGMDEINELAKAVEEVPEQRAAQKRLAEELTRIVHGERGLEIARRASEVLFGGSLAGLAIDDILAIFKDVPSTSLPRAETAGANCVDIAVAAGICKSKGETRRLISNGGFYINNRRIDSADYVVDASDLLDNRLLVLRSGKKNFRLVQIAE